METWAEVRRLHRVEGLSQRAIARRLGIARDTVAAALKRDGPPRYQRPPRGSKVDRFADRIAALSVGCFPSRAPILSLNGSTFEPRGGRR